MATNSKCASESRKARRKGKLAGLAALASLVAIGSPAPATAAPDVEVDYSDSRPSSNPDQKPVQHEQREYTQPSAALIEHLQAATPIPGYFLEDEAVGDTLFLEPQPGPHFETMLFAKYGRGGELTPAQEAAWIQLFEPLLKDGSAPI